MVDRFEQLTSSVFIVYQSILKIQRAEMAKFGLKGSHVQCLRCLASHPEGITVTQLSKLVEKDKAAISRDLTELEGKKMVAPFDGGTGSYRARLRLTEAGETVAAFVRERVALAVRKAGEGLSDTDREVFYPAFAQIASNLQSICRDGLDD